VIECDEAPSRLIEKFVTQDKHLLTERVNSMIAIQPEKEKIYAQQPEQGNQTIG
jgi:hypothetical protein